MAIPSDVAEALARLVLYNSRPYNPTTNPHGLPWPGNVTEFPRALDDAATVANWIGETGGVPGPSLEMGKSATHIVWRVVGDTAWTDLVALTDITGPTGDTGPANTLSIGTVEDGSAAGATITGTAPNQTLNLTLPQGDTGAPGLDGSDGAAATINVGTVTTVASSEPATVTNSGTSAAAVFDFEIPKGQDGSGTGDMLAATYDPNNKAADAFSLDNMGEGADAKIMTATERTKLAGIAAGAEVNVQSDWGATSGASFIQNKPTLFSGSYGDLSGKPTLGTAAPLDAGTAAGNLVQLDGDGKLPAIDGSQLTGVATAVPEVLQPSNTAPANGATDQAIDRAAITLTASGYYSLYGKTHAASQWQISTSSDFATTVYDQTVASAVTSHTVPASTLAIDSAFYWRGRYKDQSGTWSAWSAPTSFTTANILVDTPTLVSPAASATGIQESPTLTASAFSVTNGTDTHASSDWEVRLASDDSLIWSSTDDAANKTSVSVPSGNLVVSTAYKWRVRYKGTKYGLSPWSSTRTFTTAPAFVPTVLGEAFGGGYYIGNITDGGNDYALILAPKSSGQNNSLQWKTANTTTAGTTSLTNGLSNSNAMNNTTHPAAYFCRGLTIGGFTDWYLPAKDELNVIYTNKGVISGGDAIDTDTTYCWSSSEHSAAYAWIQRFSDGNQNGTTKGYSYRVRAVRRLAI